MKSHRFQYRYRDNASKLHRKIGNILRSSQMFSGYRILQEYPVIAVNGNAPSNLHYDWVIPDLFLVIEAHGAQHFQTVSFGGQKPEDGGISKLKDIQYRDEKKREYAIEAGWTYIEIPHTDYNIIDDSYVWDKFQSNQNPNPPQRIEPQAKVDAKAYRRKQYERAKKHKKDRGY